MDLHPTGRGMSRGFTFDLQLVTFSCRLINLASIICLARSHVVTLGARGFLREEPRSAISDMVKREKIDEVRKPLGPGCHVVFI